MKNVFRISGLVLIIFLIHSCKKDEPTPPVILTTTVTEITYTTATSGGEVTNDGGSPVTSRGVCWNTSVNPTIANSKTIENGEVGTFTSLLTGLTAGTKYYVRAYASNSIGTAYGNEVWFTTLEIAIGSSYQGGIVAYILQSGDPGYIAGETHGLIAAPSDQSTGLQWYNGSNTITSATATALGTGNANTNTIVSSQGEGSYAAKMCYDLVLGDYSDWCLPSKTEINKLYLNKAAIGGFASEGYWSSSELTKNTASVQHFGDGFVVVITSKFYANYVRAVRSF